MSKGGGEVEGLTHPSWGDPESFDCSLFHGCYVKDDSTLIYISILLLGSYHLTILEKYVPLPYSMTQL